MRENTAFGRKLSLVTKHGITILYRKGSVKESSGNVRLHHLQRNQRPCTPVLDLIFLRARKPNRHSSDLLHAVYDMAAVDFLHLGNPPTCAGVEPATLGAEGQRHTNNTIQPALVLNLSYHTPLEDAPHSLRNAGLTYQIVRNGIRWENFQI
ncbi:hypothetical protein TNCV_604581 [Trichonephila clavipes]|nr:hypothetical protein TNCV_604581 [Trichonephila clavipes]